MATRVLLVDDHRIVRAGVKEMLGKYQDIEVAGEVDSGQAALELVNELKPDVIIIDIAMPGISGIETTSRILAANPQMKVIALTMYSDWHFIEGMLKAGAIGYLSKDCAPEDIATAIYSVMENNVYLSPKIASIYVKGHLQKLRNGKAASALLTEREQEILRLIVTGHTSRQIAESLSINFKTVETHRQRIMNKLGIHHIPGLTKYAIKEGLISLETYSDLV